LQVLAKGISPGASGSIRQSTMPQITLSPTAARSLVNRFITTVKYP
jgi:hypothetical protein